MLKDHGISPTPGRPSSWRTFLRAHWGAIAAADFFTTEVWTPRGLVTYYTLFVLDLKSRRVRVVGSTPNPDAAFMAQAARGHTDTVDGFLAGHRVLLCDRDGKWTEGFRRIVEGSGVRIILTPFQAPNANAYAERFVRSVREECLDRLILFGERRLRRVLDEFVAHYQRELQQLSAEMTRLSVAMAQGGPIAELRTALHDRQARRQSLEAALDQAKHLNPGSELDLVHLERTVRDRVKAWHDLLWRDPAAARALIREALDGRLQFTPRTEKDWRGYEYTGRWSVSRLVLGCIPKGMVTPGGSDSGCGFRLDGIAVA